MRKEFAVVFCADRTMFFPALVVAEEAARVPGADRYDVVLLVDKDAVPPDFPAWHRARGATFEVREVAFAEIVPPPNLTRGRHPPAAIVRLYLPEYFSDSYRRILYLDCDSEIRSAIDRIFDIDTHGEAVAAADDLGASPLDGAGTLLSRAQSRGRKGIGLSPHARYANSGVLLIDVAEWRRRSLTEHTIGFLAAHPDLCPRPDQDALNAVLQGDYLSLSPRWNYMPRLMARCSADGLIDPIVVHFASRIKPWHFERWDGDPSAAERYRRFFRDSPWPDALPSIASPSQARLDWRARGRAFDRALRIQRRKLAGAVRGVLGDRAAPSRAQRLLTTYLRETRFADADLVD